MKTAKPIIAEKEEIFFVENGRGENGPSMTCAQAPWHVKGRCDYRSRHNRDHAVR